MVLVCAGLDSHAALVLMEYMRKLTGEQRTVVCSIHQPRQAIWEMFHKVEVLSEGHLMYFGSTTGAVAWFGRDLGYCYNPTQDGTPSDWLLDLVSIGFGRAGGHSEGMSSLAEVGAAAERFRLEALPGRMTSSGALAKQASEVNGSAGGVAQLRLNRGTACNTSCLRTSRITLKMNVSAMSGTGLFGPVCWSSCPPVNISPIRRVPQGPYPSFIFIAVEVGFVSP